jgi:hypothetical protein
MLVLTKIVDEGVNLVGGMTEIRDELGLDRLQLPSRDASIPSRAAIIQPVMYCLDLNTSSQGQSV